MRGRVRVRVRVPSLRPARPAGYDAAFDRVVVRPSVSIGVNDRRVNADDGAPHLDCRSDVIRAGTGFSIHTAIPRERMETEATMATTDMNPTANSTSSGTSHSSGVIDKVKERAAAQLSTQKE